MTIRLSENLRRLRRQAGLTPIRKRAHLPPPLRGVQVRPFTIKLSGELGGVE